jgi:SAM-dependent methyltransferase
MNFLLIVDLIVLALITVVLFVITGSNILGLICSAGVPFIPLTRAKLKFLDEKIKLDAGARLVDLGCGDGRVLQLFEKQGVKNSVGYEVNWWAALQARWRKRFFDLTVEIRRQNFLRTDLSGFNVVFCYLMPQALLRLREKFDRELRPGTKIVSYDFEIEDWRPAQDVFEEGKGRKKNKIFVYEV